MKNFLHKEAADGRWFKMSLMEQLGNIGSEVGRARKWQGKDEKIFHGAVERALDLFDLTLEDDRWKGRWHEIARSREVFVDAIFGFVCLSAIAFYCTPRRINGLLLRGSNLHFAR